MDKCTHHWIIETVEPGQVTSQGIYKYCGERREFLNCLPVDLRDLNQNKGLYPHDGRKNKRLKKGGKDRGKHDANSII